VKTKPLVISGKQLLLALDILQFIQDVRLMPRSRATQRPSRFSESRMLEIIRRFRPTGRHSRTEGDIANNSYVWSGTHQFLRANATAIADIMFDAMPLFRGIASGELTEEDFK
jgi:hypothetical protein